MKTKTLLLSLLIISINGQLKTQNNASYRLNTSPIGGTYNTGMGWNALRLNTTGRYNSALGYEALFNNTIGDLNVANGYQTLYNNIDGHSNTANGSWALFNNSNGYSNVANGLNALYHNSVGGVNVAIGVNALYQNNDGSYNTACGSEALSSNIVGNRNVAFGFQALAANLVDDNTAVGYKSLANNSSGTFNSAFGNASLFANTNGSANAAFGLYACHDNSTGSSNSGFGYHALHQNSTGNENSAFGNQALDQNTGSYNTAVGRNALSSNAGGNKNTCVGASAFSMVNGGSFNTALGYNVTATPTLILVNNTTGIGANAIVLNSNEVQLGDANVTAIRMVNAANYIGSDARFKTNINEDDVKGLAFIKLLRPVAYNFDTRKYTEFVTKSMPDSIRKTYLDKDFSQSTAIRKNGFIAQEVEKAAKDVDYDFDGVKAPKNENDHYIVAYSAFVVPLVKAVQEQQKMIEDQKRSNDQLKQQLEVQMQLISDLQAKNGILNSIDQNIGALGFSMGQNEPNPFNNETVIKYTLQESTVKAYMAIYDLSGKQIKTIDLTQKGATSLTLTSDQLVPGIYIYSIVADGKVMESKRMVVAEK